MSRRRWKLADGPWISMQMVDGVGWGYELERGQKRRSVTVIVNRRALAADVAVAAETRAAIDTQGRSEANKAAHLADPPRVVVLGRGGYLSAPPTLERAAASGTRLGLGGHFGAPTGIA